MKDDYDGAEPSGNSIALLDLLRLAHLTDRDEYRQASVRTLDALMPKMSSQPVAVPQMLVALDYSLAAKREVVIAGDRNAEPTRALLRELRGRFLPYTAPLLIDSGSTREKLTRIFPAAGLMRPVDSQSTPTFARIIRANCPQPRSQSSPSCYNEFENSNPEENSWKDLEPR